VRAEA
jgi:RNA-directed DNA polymerase